MSNPTGNAPRIPSADARRIPPGNARTYERTDLRTNYSPSEGISPDASRAGGHPNLIIAAVLLALAGYLEPIQDALSDIPGHLRWLAEGTDLAALLGIPTSPVVGSGVAGPVGPVVGSGVRGAEEIRADVERLASSSGFGVRGRLEVTEAVHRLVADVPSLLAEVERLRGDLRAANVALDEMYAEANAEAAASRDVEAAAAELEQLRADLITADLDQLRDEVDRLRWVAQSVEPTLREHYLYLIECDHEGERNRPYCGCSLVDLGWHPNTPAARDAWIEHFRAALAAAAVTIAAPPPHQSWCALARVHGMPCNCGAAAVPTQDRPRRFDLRVMCLTPDACRAGTECMVGPGCYDDPRHGPVAASLPAEDER